MSGELEKNLCSTTSFGEIKSSRVAPETITNEERMKAFFGVIAADAEEFPELRPVDQMKKIIGLMGKDPDFSIENQAAQKVLDILQVLYTENPNRSNYDALAVLSSSISSVAQKKYGSCDKAHEVLFENEQLAQFIVENANEIKEFVAGRTNCPTILQRTFPFAEYLSSLKEVPSIIEIGCGPGAVAGLFLSHLETFLKNKDLLLPNSQINLEELKRKIGSGSLIKKYLGLDLIKQDKENSYFSDPDNVLFLLNLYGLKAPERPAAETMINALQEIYQDDSKVKKNDNINIQQMDCVSLLENKDKITEFIGKNGIIYSSYTVYQLSKEALNSLLEFAAETGYELVLQGDPLSKGIKDFTGDKNWDIQVTKYKVSKVASGKFKLVETPLGGVGDNLNHSYHMYEEIDQIPNVFEF